MSTPTESRQRLKALPVGGSIPGSVEGESVFVVLVTLLASWNELDVGSHIAMIVPRVGRLIYHWALVNVRRLVSYLLKGSRP